MTSHKGSLNGILGDPGFYYRKILPTIQRPEGRDPNSAGIPGALRFSPAIGAGLLGVSVPLGLLVPKAVRGLQGRILEVEEFRV